MLYENELIFISYKSENINIARHIAEILIANGYKVWFAEYKILIKDYDNFESLINAGLGKCSKAIIITDNK